MPVVRANFGFNYVFSYVQNHANEAMVCKELYAVTKYKNPENFRVFTL